MEKHVIKVIDTSSRSRTPISEGNVRKILPSSDDATRVQVAIEEVEPGKALRIAPSDKTQVVYVLEGKDAEVSYTKAGKAGIYTAQRRSGIYLEPTEEATVKASGTALTLLLVTVPKHTRPGDESPVGYFFEEAKLRALVDEKGIRTRTFWVNKETGLSGSYDLQIGRMLYAPDAYSPRHVHVASKTSPVTPEHFYFIEKGTGEVKHDNGSLPVGPGSLVLIPAGEWHQLVASGTGFDYIEFQAPFDFATTMDHDPLGKNWYIKGTDDGTGKPTLWVQS
jgi:mannose-6-phosphate isomerase-like protein (cupin superfamily)